MNIMLGKDNQPSQQHQTKIPLKATYAIAKSLKHISAAKFYLDMVIVEAQPKMNAKKFLKSLVSKCESLLTDIKLRINAGEARDILLQEMEDPLQFDVLADNFISLNGENRTLVEEYIAYIYERQINKEERIKNGYTPEYQQGLIQGKDHMDALIKEEEKLAIMRRERDFYVRELGGK